MVASPLFGQPVYAESAGLRAGLGLAHLHDCPVLAGVRAQHRSARPGDRAGDADCTFPTASAMRSSSPCASFRRSRRRSRSSAPPRRCAASPAGAACRPHPRDQALCHAAAGRQPAPASMMVMSMEARAFGAYPRPHLRRRAAPRRFWNTTDDRDCCRRHRLVYKSGDGLGPFGLYLFAKLRRSLGNENRRA